MKKFLTLFLTPLVAVVLILLKIDRIDKWLTSLDAGAPTYITFFLVVATLYNHYYTVYSPYKKYEKIVKNKWFLLKERTDKLAEQYKESNFAFRLNIMIPNRKFFLSIEPSQRRPGKKKFALTGRVFNVVWTYGNEDVHKELRLTIRQGVCGEAFRNGNKVYGAVVTPEEVGNYNFNFTDQQKDLTKDLVIVASCPIRVKEDGIDQQTTKIIGVLNIESDSAGSEVLIKNPALRKGFYDELAKLSNICSKLL